MGLLLSYPPEVTRIQINPLHCWLGRSSLGSAHPFCPSCTLSPSPNLRDFWKEACTQSLTPAIAEVNTQFTSLSYRDDRDWYATDPRYPVAGVTIKLWCLSLCPSFTGNLSYCMRGKSPPSVSLGTPGELRVDHPRPLEFRNRFRSASLQFALTACAGNMQILTIIVQNCWV